MRSDLEIWKKIALNRQAEIEELMFFKELVVRIAIIAHNGDLIGRDESDIRRLTLPYWEKELRDRLQLEICGVRYEK